ncbi:MAG: sulfurtransferase [Pseudomonadota bacterium]|nr:sulfurtransferase [Gammaproteobacteria bacterium]MDQ3580420.1 sulfurtransferase [Pseudomonadota bacterium]
MDRSPAPYQSIVTCETLARYVGDPAWVVVDCRFDLADPEAGGRAYRHRHIAGAAYAHLDRDLCGPPVITRGRHPLPTAEALQATLGRLGIDDSRQVVAYDDTGGAMAARLWWLLRYMGHGAVALLDGGWDAWEAAGLPTDTGEERTAARVFLGAPRTEWLVRIDHVSDAPLLIDSRDPARYRGEVEPLDPVAGHIPGAVNYCWKENLDGQGRFLAAATLRARIERLLAGTPSREAVFYCGSGVTACHNLVAVVHAGLPAARLYAGSWSEWCSDQGRPVVRGPAPRPADTPGS